MLYLATLKDILSKDELNTLSTFKIPEDKYIKDLTIGDLSQFLTILEDFNKMKISTVFIISAKALEILTIRVVESDKQIFI